MSLHTNRSRRTTSGHYRDLAIIKGSKPVKLGYSSGFRRELSAEIFEESERQEKGWSPARVMALDLSGGGPSDLLASRRDGE